MCRPEVPSTDDLSAALEVLLQDADIWRSKALITGCELDIFGVLDGGAASALWVAEAVGAAPEPAARLLSALHEMGYLQSENGIYRNAPVSATFLVPGKPHYLGSWIRLQGTDWEALGGLTDIIRTGQRTATRKLISGPYSPADLATGSARPGAYFPDSPAVTGARPYQHQDAH